MTNKEKEERSKYLKEFIFERCCLLGNSHLNINDKNVMYWNTIEAFIFYICEPNNLSPKIIITPDEEMGNSRATYNPNTNEIKIKQSLCNYEHTDGSIKNLFENIEKMAQTFQTLTHEFAHIIDERVNPETSQDVDKTIASYHEDIKKLSKVNPEKKEIYEKFALSVYFTSPSEVFAEKFAHIKTIGFFQELIKYAKIKYPYDKILDELPKEKMPKEKITELILNGSVDNRITRIYTKHFLDQANEDYQTFEALLEFHKLRKTKLQPEVYADFVAAAEQWAGNPYHSPFSAEDFLFLSKMKEFYYPEFINEWYKLSNSSTLDDAFEEHFIDGNIPVTAALLRELKQKREAKIKVEQQNANLNAEIPHAPDYAEAMREAASIQADIPEVYKTPDKQENLQENTQSTPSPATQENLEK